MNKEDSGKTDALLQQILILRLIAEIERARCVYNCFVDYIKAYDSVWHEGLWAVLHGFGVPGKLVTLLRNLYMHSPSLL